MRASPRWRRTRVERARLLPAAWLLALAGCTVTDYHPMSGLHRPVVVNPGYANFVDLELSLKCLPGPVATLSEARTLCQRLSRMFENQGATVQTRTTPGRAQRVEEDGGGEPKPEPTPRTALNVTLSARLVHKEESSFLWWSWTTDYTFAQDVEIRDETGFLLIRDTLTGRFVRNWGFFSDAGEDFSKDYYGQLSQLAHNAKVRRRVLARGAVE